MSQGKKIRQQMLSLKIILWYFVPSFWGSSSASGYPPGSGRYLHLAVPRLDIKSLVPVVQDLSTAGIAPSTRKAGSRSYRLFCNQVGLQTHPVSEQGLKLFAAHLFTQQVDSSLSKNQALISYCNNHYN